MLVPFMPALVESRSASVTITDAGGASPQTITLTGTGTESRRVGFNGKLGRELVLRLDASTSVEELIRG